MKLTVCVLLALLLICPAVPSPSRVTLGDDILLGSEFSLVRGKSVGIVTNQSGRLSNGTFLVDTLLARGVKVVALFAPEHGIRGEGGAGEEVRDSIDARTGITVFSLYGPTTKPTPAMLRGIQVLVYDIQDVGARFYTYLSTMTLSMEAAAEAGIPFIVCDRPDPLGGNKIDGPVTEDSLRSFVGMHPVPVIYGLTCGELATLINGEGWLSHRIHADLHVVKLRGWTRDMSWEETGLPWVLPSPNIRTPEASLVYPGTVYFEATNISEGRGTELPFQIVGAPFVKRYELWSAMTGLNLPGVRFTAVAFVPASSKYSGEKCEGIRINVIDRNAYDPLRVGMELLKNLHSMYPQEFSVRERSLRRLVGSERTVQDILNGVEFERDREAWQPGLDHFREILGRCLLYPSR